MNSLGTRLNIIYKYLCLYNIENRCIKDCEYLK